MKRSSVTKSGYYPSPGSPEAILFLMRKYGLWNLGGYDGCMCTDFKIGSWEIHVSCHKSERSIRVVNNYMGRSSEDMELVAKEVCSQVNEKLGKDSEPYDIRFCDFRKDNHNGRWENKKWVIEYLCCYCGKNRTDPKGYLCKKCSKNKDAVSCYPFGMQVDPLQRRCPQCASASVSHDLFGLSEMKEEVTLIDGLPVGLSISGTLPDQKESKIFSCKACGNSWREQVENPDEVNPNVQG